MVQFMNDSLLHFVPSLVCNKHCDKIREIMRYAIYISKDNLTSFAEFVKWHYNCVIVFKRSHNTTSESLYWAWLGDGT